MVIPLTNVQQAKGAAPPPGHSVYIHESCDLETTGQEPEPWEVFRYDGVCYSCYGDTSEECAANGGACCETCETNTDDDDYDWDQWPVQGPVVPNRGGPVVVHNQCHERHNHQKEQLVFASLATALSGRGVDLGAL